MKPHTTARRRPKMLAGNACKGESSAESSQKARANGASIRHFRGAIQISLPSQPLPLEPACKFSPPKPNQHKRNRTLKSPPGNHHPDQIQAASVVVAAAVVIANNIDILKQILLYLPPKSLLRFQSVSKKWLSIISSPVFRTLHSRLYPTIVSSSAAATEALFLLGWNWMKTPGELSFIPLSDGYVNSMGNIVSHSSNLVDKGQICGLHSCNGLLALVFKLDDYDDHREFVVYNPTTRQHKLIPQPNNSLEIEIWRNFEALNVVFDPLKSDHYKLVYIWSIDPHEYTIVYGFSVYASETGIWRESMDTLPIEFDLPTYFGNGVLWNGDLHWVSDWKYTICFELDKECLHPMTPSLPVPLGEWELWYFGESNGCLYVIEVNDPFGVLFDVFEMSRDYSEWVLKYHIDLAPLTILYPSMVDEFFDPIDDRQCRFGMPFFLEDEKEKKASLLISLQGKLILYNITDNVVKELAEVGPVYFGYSWKGQFYQWNSTFRHMETLASV